MMIRFIFCLRFIYLLFPFIPLSFLVYGANFLQLSALNVVYEALRCDETASNSPYLIDLFSTQIKSLDLVQSFVDVSTFPILLLKLDILIDPIDLSLCSEYNNSAAVRFIPRIFNNFDKSVARSASLL